MKPSAKQIRKQCEWRAKAEWKKHQEVPLALDHESEVSFRKNYSCTGSTWKAERGGGEVDFDGEE